MDTLTLQPFCGVWSEKIELAKTFKYEKFGKDAAEAMKYYLGPHDFLYERRGQRDGLSVVNPDDAKINAPPFRMTLNKVSEMVQIFGPMLYAKNPIRVCKPRHTWMPPEELVTGPRPPQELPPNMELLSGFMQGVQKWVGVEQQGKLIDLVTQAKCDLIEQYLNYTPNELGLKTEMRLGVDEAIVKGRGVFWTELYQEPAVGPNDVGRRLVGTFFGSVDELHLDPDVKNYKDAKWCARECIEPVWKLERDYNLPKGTIRGTMDSLDTKAFVNRTEEGTTAAKQGRTADLVRYYKIWSKMGLGVRLKDAAVSKQSLGPVNELAEQFGDYVYLVIVPGLPYPINIPENLIAPAFEGQDPQAIEAIKEKVQWPIPFWADNEWPFTPIDLHPQFDCPWPTSHLKPALGEQIFLDWVYSCLTTHIYKSVRDFIVVAKSAGEEIKNQIQNGGSYSFLELETVNKNIGDLVTFLQHPPINKDIFTIAEAVERNFEKRTGLTDMIYGQTVTQDRSAAASQIKSSAMNIRPDDMADCVELAATTCARKEAIAARLLITGNDVRPILGDFAATFWDQHVHTDDLALACREFDYRIEASSARKPNKDTDIANTQEAAQAILPTLMQQAQLAVQQQTADPFKAVNAFLREYCKARGYNPDDWFIQQPDPQVVQFQQMQANQPKGQPQQPPGPPQGPPQQGTQGPPPGPPQMQPGMPPMQVTPQ